MNNEDKKIREELIELIISPEEMRDLLSMDYSKGRYDAITKAVTSDWDDEDTNSTPFVILYVHELQHALKLRRIKKEIVL